jgi:alpha-L-fucosidase
VCMTLNRHWGYNSNDQDWKTPETVIRNLADIASKGGNYLLNVGPTAEGLIPGESVRILREVGAWMQANGESIYGTTAGPVETAPAWGRLTQKGKKLYLHVFEWPAGGSLSLAGITGKAKGAYLLADTARKPLRVEEAAGEVRISLPQAAPDRIDTVVALEME